MMPRFGCRFFHASGDPVQQAGPFVATAQPHGLLPGDNLVMDLGLLPGDNLVMDLEAAGSGGSKRRRQPGDRGVTSCSGVRSGLGANLGKCRSRVVRWPIAAGEWIA